MESSVSGKMIGCTSECTGASQRYVSMQGKISTHTHLPNTMCEGTSTKQQLASELFKGVSSV